MQPYKDANYFANLANDASSPSRSQQAQKIEQILTEASKSGNKDELKNSIMKIISSVNPENRQSAFQYIDYIAKGMEDKEREQAYTDAGLNYRLPDSINKQMLENRGKNAALGASSQIDWTNASEEDLYQYMAVPELRPMAQEALKGMQEEKKESKKLQNKLAPYQSALNIVDELEDLIVNSSSAIGPMAGTLNQLPYAVQARQRMVTLGNSLLQLALPLTIRNSVEFQEAQKSLTNPDSRVSTNLGAVKALRDIIESNINSELSAGNTMDSRQKPGGQGQLKSKKVKQETVNRLFK